MFTWINTTLLSYLQTLYFRRFIRITDKRNVHVIFTAYENPNLLTNATEDSCFWMTGGFIYYIYLQNYLTSTITHLVSLIIHEVTKTDHIIDSKLVTKVQLTSNLWIIQRAKQNFKFSSFSTLSSCSDNKKSRGNEGDNVFSSIK